MNSAMATSPLFDFIFLLPDLIHKILQLLVIHLERLLPDRYQSSDGERQLSLIGLNGIQRDSLFRKLFLQAGQ
jgi:hypothetical protein